MMSESALYAYATKNGDLVKDLKLVRHPEGGYFAETGRWNEKVPSPFADGAERPLATTIYYLLTADEPKGVFHRNLSNTMHVHHQGRATYTLIDPPVTPRGTPVIRQVTMGTNTAAGEVRQLFVGNSWKRSEIPPEDLKAVQDGKTSPDEVGCLITEVVAPGFVWEDHAFLTLEELHSLFKNGEDGGEKLIELFKPYLRKT